MRYIFLPEKPQRCQHLAVLKKTGGERGLIGAIIARAVIDFFSTDRQLADSARWYFAGADYENHLRLLGLPVEWLPVDLAHYVIELDDDEQQQKPQNKNDFARYSGHEKPKKAAHRDY